MFLQIQQDIGAESLPGSQKCTNCYCLAPVSPAANACNRQKSKRQQINASKSDWICQNIPTGTQHVHSKYKCPKTTLPTGCALDTQQPATHPPTGQYLGCVWVLALTETPLGFKPRHWFKAGLRPASSENLAAMFLQIQLDIGAESLPGSQNCTNCYCLAPVWPAANARNRQKSKRQQINASKIIERES